LSFEGEFLPEMEGTEKTKETRKNQKKPNEEQLKAIQ